LRLPMTIIFKTSFGTIDYRPVLLVKVTDEQGRVGLGESSLLDMPISEHETTEKAIRLFEKHVIPKILGRSFSSIRPLYVLCAKEFVHYPVTMTGMESAFLHLFAQQQNIPFSTIFGGRKKKVLIGMSIGIQPTRKDLYRAIQQSVDQGYGRIKIKIEPGYDVDVLHDVRTKFPDICLSVDANAAYRREHFSLLEGLDVFHLAMVEQPFAEKALSLHAKLQRRIKTPICLDESAHDLASTKQAIFMGAGKIVNIKPARVGGYRIAKQIHDFCQKRHVPCWVGGRLESGLGSLFNLAFATLPNITLASEMLPSFSFLKKDILAKSIPFKQGFMSFPVLSHGKISLNEEVIKKYTVYQRSFTL